MLALLSLSRLPSHASNSFAKTCLSSQHSHIRIRLSFRQAKYQQWVVSDVRTIVQVLEDLDSVKPPIDFLLELLPRLQIRYYSISSSAKVGTAVPLALVQHP